MSEAPAVYRPVQKQSDPQNPFVRWMRVWDSEGNEVRLGTIFNYALLSGLLFVLAVATILVTGSIFAELELGLELILAFGPLTVFLHLVLLRVSKQGRYRQAARIYVFAFFSLITLAVIFTNGATSSYLIVYLWPLLLAVLFVSSATAGGLLTMMVLLWFALLFGERLGFYTPLLQVPAITTVELIARLLLLIMTMMLGMLAATTRHLRETRERAEFSTEALERSQQALEAEVAVRTKEARRFSEQLDVVQRLNRLAVLAPDLPALLKGTLDLVKAQFSDAYRIGIFLLDESGERLVLKAATGLDRGEEFQLRVGEEGIVGQAAALRRTYLAADVSQDPYYYTLPELERTRSAVAIPVLVEDEMQGVFILESERLNAFDETRLQVLEALAMMLGVAIQNVRRLERLETTVERLSQYEQQDFLQQWRESLLQAGGRLQYLYDRVAVGPTSESAQQLLLLGQEPGVAAEVEGVHTLPGADGTELLIVPVRVRDQTLGRFVFEGERPWRKEELEVAENVTVQLGVALENVRLLEETRQRASFEHTVSEVTGHIRSQVEIETVLQEALRELSQVLDAERASAHITLERASREAS